MHSLHVAGPTAVLQKFQNDFYGTQASLVVGVSGLVIGISSFVVTPLLGSASDRWGRKPILLLSCLAGVLPLALLCCFDLTATAERFSVYVAATTLCGCFSPGIVGMCLSYIADTVPVAGRGPVAGLIMAVGQGVGSMLAPSVFAAIDADGARDLLTLRIALGLALLQLTWMLAVPESLRHRGCGRAVTEKPQFVRSFQLLTNSSGTACKLLRLLTAIVLLCSLVKTACLQSLALYAMQVYPGFGVKETSVLQTISGVVTFFALLSLRFVLRCIPRRSVFCAVSACGLVATIVFAMPHAPQWSVFVCEALLAVPSIVQTLATSIATSAVPGSQTGEAAMLISTAFSLSISGGPLLFGAVRSATVSLGYDGCVFLPFTAIMLGALILSCRFPNDAAIEHILEQSVAHDPAAKSATGSLCSTVDA
jgi:DHA1 family tetracycline resistance protein-like MFS transporter